jgi:hypothetical protein
MTELIFGILLFAIGLYDLRRRHQLADAVNKNPNHKKYIAWNLLSSYWRSTPQWSVEIACIFPIDKGNADLMKVIARGWYLRLILIFGVLFFALGLVSIVKSSV